MSSRATIPNLKYEHGTVVSYDPIASAMGSRVLLEGGNAVDAAIATGFALAVVYPQAGNLGGGGFMMIAPNDGNVEFLDYRETAPRKLDAEQLITPASGLRAPSVFGALSVGVPGTVAGFAEAHKRYGRLSWDRVIGVAIDLAENGFRLTTRQAAYFSRYAQDLSYFDSTRHYFMSKGADYLPGSLIQQPHLTRCLRLLADRGPEEFYEGSIAELIANEIEAGGGVLDLDDLRAYEAHWRNPITTRFLGKEVISSPFPSGGGMVIALTLRLLEASGIDAHPPGSLARYNLLGRCFRVAFSLRHRYAADPETLTPEDVEEIENLFSMELKAGDLERFTETIVSQETAHAESLDKNTTHYCVLDAEGNGVSNTYSLNTLFGSKLAVSGAGFLLNNSIDDFRIGENIPNWYGIIDGPRNQLMPGRRPVGSMAPTIVRSSNRPAVELLMGGSGGPTIPTLVTQAIVGTVIDGKSLHEALDAPRVHHQFQKAELCVEDMVPAEIREQLFVGDPDPVRTVLRLGIGAGIERDPSTGRVVGALDKRFSHYAVL